MELTINGEARTLPSGLTVKGLLEHLELKETRVAVEVNRDIVPKARYAEHSLADGDQVEIVTFVGGG